MDNVQNIEVFIYWYFSKTTDIIPDVQILLLQPDDDFICHSLTELLKGKRQRNKISNVRPIFKVP